MADRWVVRDVISRLAALCMAAFCISSSPSGRAAEDSQVAKGVRESLEAKIRPGFDHVRKIEGPRRTITAKQIENEYLASDAKFLVVGSISDRSVGLILEKIGERAKRHLTITGDEQFAVIEVGDPQRDPCCFSRVLLANMDGTWSIVSDIWRSH